MTPTSRSGTFKSGVAEDNDSAGGGATGLVAVAMADDASGTVREKPIGSGACAAGGRDRSGARNGKGTSGSAGVENAGTMLVSTGPSIGKALPMDGPVET